MTRCRLSAALVVLVLLGTPWADAAAQRTAAEVAAIRQRAEQGDAAAQSLLGFVYSAGDGVPQDFVEAHKWVNLAASRETDNAPRNLYVDARNRLAERMTPAQIAEAQTLAREWQAAFDARQE